MIVSKHCMDVFLITFMGMRMVMMIAVMTMGIMIIMTVMTHTIVAVTMIVKMIATGSTQRKQPLSDTNNNNTLIHF